MVWISAVRLTVVISVMASTVCAQRQQEFKKSKKAGEALLPWSFISFLSFSFLFFFVIKPLSDIRSEFEPVIQSYSFTKSVLSIQNKVTSYWNAEGWSSVGEAYGIRWVNSPVTDITETQVTPQEPPCSLLAFNSVSFGMNWVLMVKP